MSSNGMGPTKQVHLKVGVAIDDLVKAVGGVFERQLGLRPARNRGTISATSGYYTVRVAGGVEVYYYDTSSVTKEARRRRQDAIVSRGLRVLGAEFGERRVCSVNHSGQRGVRVALT